MIHLANGKNITIYKNSVLIGYAYEDLGNCLKQRAEEFRLSMEKPNWTSLLKVLFESYCFEVRDNGNRGKIYFSHSVNAISISK